MITVLSSFGKAIRRLTNDNIPDDDLAHVYYFSRENSHFVDVSPCAPTLGFPKTVIPKVVNKG
jgi:hypothetical protein